MRVRLSLLAATVLVLASCGGSDVRSRLEAGFDNPEAQYRPRTWWHWMNGNVTRDGIRKDLEWMDRAGISGVFLFDAAHSTPQIVDERVVYMSEAWDDALAYTLDVADSLGMEFYIASSPGWSLTGGPWVSCEDAQKKVVWSELAVRGGSHVQVELPLPPSCSGPYQDELAFPKDPDRYRWYRDLYVIAVKAPVADKARVLHSEVKAGFKMDYTVSDHFRTPETDDFTALEDVVDLSDRCRDGVLDWDAPDGEWKVFRFGCSLIGHTNGPAPVEATGLEVDKLDAGAVRRYFDNYLSLYANATGGRFGKGGICGMVIDSYESGKSTWTPKMEEEFLARRGYSLRPWLPVLTGQIIGSAEMSERFLFDWRQTLGELLAENHYDAANDILHPMGIIRYSESHEERRAFTGDGMAVKRSADVPMSAFWVRYRAGWYALYPGAEADLRESSSVAHIYGQNVCAAESFTTNGRIGKWDGFGAYRCHPGNLKRVADAAMAQGLNRFVVHTSVHQPLDDVFPGLGLSTYGQWFTRHDTWAEEARSWTDYLSRSCYMLQQGRNVADIAYFYGEDKNVTGRFYEQRVCIPRGWNYDFVGGDALLGGLRVEGGELVSVSGLHYRMLALDNELRYVSIPVLEKIAEIARAGVLVCGPRPLAPANLAATDEEFAALVADIWDSGRANVTEVPSCCEGEELSSAMASAFARGSVQPDVAGMTDSLSFVHRSLGREQIYWVANICSRPRTVELSLRCDGFRPEIWHADTGVREPVEWRREDGRTVVTLPMSRDDAQFIVFAEKTDLSGESLRGREETLVAQVEGPWTVGLHQKGLEPHEVVFDALADLSQSDDPYVRYYSGTAVYRCTFEASVPAADEVWIDLGEVHNMARVILNGRDLGLAWKSPYRLNVAGALVDGVNALEIRVINSWSNRLIGDESLEAENRSTWTASRFYEADDELEVSGLIGPVGIKAVTLL